MPVVHGGGQLETGKVYECRHSRKGTLLLKVHRHIHYPKEQWLMSTGPALFDCVELQSPDIEEAKCQAVAMLQAACQQVIDEIVGA